MVVSLNCTESELLSRESELLRSSFVLTCSVESVQWVNPSACLLFHKERAAFENCEDICPLHLINIISSVWINLTSLSDTQQLVYLQDKSSWRVCGDPIRDCDINAPGDDLSKGPSFVLTDKSPAIKLLFAGLFNLIICHCCSAKMSLHITSAA